MLSGVVATVPGVLEPIVMGVTAFPDVSKAKPKGLSTTFSV